MKFPSIAVLSKGLTGTLRRWPLSIALAIVASILLMRMSYDPSRDNDRMWAIIYSCYEGMLLTIAATAIAAARGWGRGGRVLVQGLALAMGLLFSSPLSRVGRRSTGRRPIISAMWRH